MLSGLSRWRRAAFHYFGLLVGACCLAPCSGGVVRSEHRVHVLDASDGREVKVQILGGSRSDVAMDPRGGLNFAEDPHAELEVRREASSSPGLARLLGLSAAELLTPTGAALEERSLGSADDLSKLYPTESRDCPHEMSGVSDDAVLALLSRSRTSSNIGAAQAATAGSAQLKKLRGQRLFIAACLHQSEEVAPHWTVEVLRLLIALKDAKNAGLAKGMFVSVYESGSTDQTKQYLTLLEGHLKFLGVPHQIVRGTMVRGKLNRIDFLSKIRNKAMEPLHSSGNEFDRVLWLSDIYFCADAVLQMLVHSLPTSQGGLGAEAVCGTDYTHAPYCMFYDTWASHDVEGQNFRHVEPITWAKSSENAYKQGQPFQVFSCWSSMVVFNAEVFQQERLFFRRSRQQLHECPVAETELIFHDMWAAGRGKVAVSPSAAVAYNGKDWKACARPRQRRGFDDAGPMVFQPPPEMLSCCPLRENATFSLPQDCRWENWRNGAAKFPVPRLQATA